MIAKQLQKFAWSLEVRVKFPPLKLKEMRKASEDSSFLCVGYCTCRLKGISRRSQNIPRTHKYVNAKSTI